jgi:outer membrane protein
MKKLNLMLFCLLLVRSVDSYAEDLLSIYQQALDSAPKIKSAQLQIQIAQAQKGQALGEMLPQVNGSANWSLNDQRREIQTRNALGQIVNGIDRSNYGGKRYTISLNQTLLDFAKFWNWKRAQKVEDQTNAENADTLNKLIYEVVDRYFSVLEADDQLYFVQTETQATKKRLEQTQKQYAKQLVKVTDLYEVEALLDKNQADEIEAEKILAVAKEELIALTGKQPDNLQKLAASIAYQPLTGKIEDWLEVAKSQNPAIIATSTAIASAHDNVTVQQARNLPVVDLQLNYYATNTGYQSSNIGNTEVQVAAINVNMPLFSGGAALERINEAEHKLSMSKYENEDKIRGIVKETRDAFLSTNANYRRIQAAEKAVLSATKSREAMEKGFGYGVQTMGDVLNVQQNEFKVKRELSQVKYSYIKNKTRFLYATGMISEENLKEINNWLQKSLPFFK